MGCFSSEGCQTMINLNSQLGVVMMGGRACITKIWSTSEHFRKFWFGEGFVWCGVVLGYGACRVVLFQNQVSGSLRLEA